MYLCLCLSGTSPSRHTPDPPLLEPLGGDEAGSKVGVPDSLGLPPRGVILAHHLQDLPALERQTRLLARDGPVFPRVVVEEGTHEHLHKEGSGEAALPPGAQTCHCHIKGHVMTIHTWEDRAAFRIESYLETHCTYVSFFFQIESL